MIAYIPHIIVAVLIIAALFYVVGLVSSPGVSDAIGDVISDIGSGTGITRGRDYKVEIFTPQLPAIAKEGEEITVRATFVCDYDENCDIIAGAYLQPVKDDLWSIPGVLEDYQLIRGDECCPDRESSAVKQISLEPDVYTKVDLKLKIPTPDSSYTCNGFTQSDYSADMKYHVRIYANDGCYGKNLMTLQPYELRVIENPEYVPPVVNYQTPTIADGQDLFHYPVTIKYGGVSCSVLSGYQGYAYDCGSLVTGQYLSVRGDVKNNANKPLEFLSEAILIPIEHYNPWNVAGTFLMRTKSCCSDSFSYGWWVQATEGAKSEVVYALKVPKSSTPGKCNSRDYYSPSKTYYLKISDYTDCAGTQVQDIAPILVKFR